MIINDLNQIPKYAGVYKLKNKINGKVYIGKANNLKNRITKYPNENKDRPIIKAIKKYGWSNFEIEILNYYKEKVDTVTLLALETACILKYNSLIENKNGYNVCLVGNDTSGIKPSLETRKKMSKNNARKGKPILPQTSLAVSLANAKRNNSKSNFPDRSGKNNSRFDNSIYFFKNLRTNEEFHGHKMDFYKKYNLRCGDACAIIKNPTKGLWGWTVIN